MGARLSIPGGADRCYLYYLDWYVRGTVRDIPYEAVSDEYRSTFVLYASHANRLQVDFGGGFVPLTTDPDLGGVDLGPFNAGQKKSITVRYSSSVFTREERVRIYIDEGIGPEFWGHEEDYVYHDDGYDYHDDGYG